MHRTWALLIEKINEVDPRCSQNVPDIGGTVTEINAHIYQRKVVENVRRVAFIVDAGLPYGYGHLIRCIELAHQLVERKGYPVLFYVDDDRAARLLDEQGLPHLWGSYGREARSASPGKQKALFDTKNYDLAVLDIYAGRSLEAGWKTADFSETEVLVLDSLSPWTAEADRVVIPGVTAPENPERYYALTVTSPQLFHGKDHIIIRRDIRAAKKSCRNKRWDLVVYLHDEKLRQEVRDLATVKDLRIFLIDSFDETFPSLLASSYAYLGNFGYSFYEAVYLECYPFNWPLSDQHAADSRLFYQRMGLTDGVVLDLGDLMKKWRSHFRKDMVWNQAVEDGTPAIIEAMVQKKMPFKKDC